MEELEVYAVLAWWRYYPNSNNTIGVFKSYDKAVKFVEEYEASHKEGEDYDYCEIITLTVDMED